MRLRCIGKRSDRWPQRSSGWLSKELILNEKSSDKELTVRRNAVEFALLETAS
ncbi:MAG: hypothetical protein ACI882_003592, partial [Reinekea sp.]